MNIAKEEVSLIETMPMIVAPCEYCNTRGIVDGEMCDECGGRGVRLYENINEE